MSDHLVEAGVATRTRLQGSLARSTMEPPLHDIDKVIELSPGLVDELAGPDGPESAIVLIRNTLAPYLPGAFFEVKKHALGIRLANEPFDFDAVPAFATAGDDKWIRIADTKSREWKPSNTYDLIDAIASRNQICVGRFVHQGPDDQADRQSRSGRPPRPSHRDVLLRSDHRHDRLSRSHRRGAGQRRQPPGHHYCEPTGVDRISDRLDPWIKLTAEQTLGGLALRAADAVRLADEGDEEGAAHIWADLFGDDCFPRPSADEKGFLSKLWAGATATTAAAAVARPTPPTRAWRPE
jgi:hypothetical protein